MAEIPSGNPPRRPRRPRLVLPFDNRREDAGSWAYDHRMGLCVTLVVYLVLMIAFVTSKIVVGRRPHMQGMLIDMQALSDLESERDRLEEEVRRRLEQQELDWRKIRNATSNENATNEQLKDDRGTNTAAINEAAAEAERRMRANREAYERGLAEEQAIRDSKSGSADGEQRQDRKVQGRVTVSFSLDNPLRTSRRLDVPAYRCEGGGDVVVEITVDRGGKVVHARVREGGDERSEERRVGKECL